MVKRAGISRGCAVCRSRKQKCDLVRPKCSKCRRISTKCEYPTLRFFHYNGPLSYSAATTSPGGAETSIERVATRLLELYLPNDLLASKRDVEPRNWIELITHFHLVDQSVALAISALHAAFESRMEGIWAPSPDSAKCYQSAIDLVRKAISGSEPKASLSLILTCMLLAIYEAFQGSADTIFGWQTHTDGLLELVQLLGPRSFHTGDGLHLFRGFRRSAIISGIRTCKEIPLSAPEWKQELWPSEEKGHLTLTSCSDELDQILVDLPGLLMKARNLSSQPSNSRDCNTDSSSLWCRPAVNNVALALDVLSSRIEAWKASRAASVFLPSFVNDSPQSDRDNMRAHTVLIYNTARLVIGNERHLISSNRSDDEEDMKAIQSANDAIKEICAAASLILRPTASYLEQNMMSWPLGTAYSVMKARLDRLPNNSSDYVATMHHFVIVDEALGRITMDGLPRTLPNQRQQRQQCL